MGNMLFEFLRTAEWIKIEELKNNTHSDFNIKYPFIDIKDDSNN